MDKQAASKDSEQNNHLGSDASERQNDATVIAEYSNFHKELVKFTLYFSGTLFPVLFAMDELSGHLQDMFVHILERSAQHSQQYTVSDLWARVLISGLYLCMFSIYWFSRNYIRSKRKLTEIIRQNNTTVAIASNVATTNEQPDSSPEYEQQIKKLSQQLEQQRFFIKKIQTQMYEDNVRPRYDFRSFHATYTVRAGGDIEVQKHVTIESKEQEVHFWRFWAHGEKFAKPLEDELDMHIHVRALDDGNTETIPLLVDNKPTYKMFTINFLPAITPGNQRAFAIKYEWPGFLRELIETGRTNYKWDMRSFTPACPADFSVEWHFDDCYGNVLCERSGIDPPGMNLLKENRPRGTYLRYAGTNVPFGIFELSFGCGPASEN